MKIGLMEWFCEQMTGESVELYRNMEDEWCCVTYTGHCMIGYSESDINGDQDDNFLRACYIFDPSMRNIAPITLTLAHEVGHWMTRRKYNKYAALREYKRAVDAATPEEYPFIAAEKDATMWGIEWINTHLEIVKRFETMWAE